MGRGKEVRAEDRRASVFGSQLTGTRMLAYALRDRQAFNSPSLHRSEKRYRYTKIAKSWPETPLAGHSRAVGRRNPRVNQRAWFHALISRRPATPPFGGNRVASR